MVLRAMACGVDCFCGGEAEAAASWVIGAGDMMSKLGRGNPRCYPKKDRVNAMQVKPSPCNDRKINGF